MQSPITQTAAPRKVRQRPLPLIAGRQFKGITELHDEINRIRREYRPHDRPLTGSDGRLVWEWMKTHEAMELAVEAHGSACRIEVRHNPSVPNAPGAPEYNQYQFWLVFADGFEDKFGYQASKNLFGVSPTGFERQQLQWKWLRAAGRQLIADDIHERRDAHIEWDGRCEISGQELRVENTEVHHQGMGFAYMLFFFLRDYCREKGCTGFDVEVIDTDNVGGKRFADEELCEAWVQHHCMEARLQVLEREVHQAQHVGMAKAPYLELFGEAA